ncbi:hypothetical protein KBD49_11225 [Myxococcota bacterium]|jgi:hypothetical protein|nr:hypothetical protein [Myxococcota bacterium]
MNSGHRIVATALGLAFLGLWAACGGGTTGEGDGGGGDGTTGTCLPSRGADQSLEIVPDASATVVVTVEGQAQNFLSMQDNPFPDRPVHAVAAGACGKAGLLWRTAEGGLAYRELAPGAGAEETVLESLPGRWMQASLFYDGQCGAVAMVPETDGWAEHRRGAGGTWTRTPPPTPAEGAVTGFFPMGAWTDPDGGMHVLGTARFGGGAVMGWHGRRSPEPDGAWAFETFDLPRPDGIAAMRVGPDGTVHALYTRTESPCDPCNLNLYYGRKAPGGSWTEEVVQESRWGDPDDAFATEPALALGLDGEPLVAASWQQRAVTGSLKSSELRLYGRKDGDWCYETVATEVDGYRGGDGSRMTGASPALDIDAQGRVHVAFQDRAQWHDGNGWSNGIPGQIRYAIRSGKTWTLATLFRQKGQSEQARPLEGMLPSQVAVVPDGSRVFVAGVAFSWDTNSIYNQGEPGIVLRGTVVGARIGD